MSVIHNKTSRIVQNSSNPVFKLWVETEGFKGRKHKGMYNWIKAKAFSNSAENTI